MVLWELDVYMKKIFGLILCIFIFGCTGSDDPNLLPIGASNIKDVGNGWSTFNLNGKSFLYHRTWSGNLGYESITEITKGIPCAE